MGLLRATSSYLGLTLVKWDQPFDAPKVGVLEPGKPQTLRMMAYAPHAGPDDLGGWTEVGGGSGGFGRVVIPSSLDLYSQHIIVRASLKIDLAYTINRL